MSNLPPVTVASNHAAAGVPKLSVLVVGPWGSGKTTWAARAPNPLFLLTEPQGRAAITATNPNAQIIAIDTWETFTAVLRLISGASEFEAADGQSWFAVQYGSKVVRFQTLCIDGLTDLQNKLVESMTRSDPSSGLTLPGYNDMARQFRRVLEQIRSLPCTSISTLLAQRLTSEDGASTWDVTFIGKATKATYGQYFSAVGFATKVDREADGKAKTWMGIRWQGGEGIPCRPFFGFPRVSENTTEPGVTTIGSLMLSAFPDTPSIPRAVGDSAAHVKDPLPSYGSPQAATGAPVNAPAPAPITGSPLLPGASTPAPEPAPEPTPAPVAEPEPTPEPTPQRTVKTSSSSIRF